MGRILAIDYGSKRSGIATTDPLGIIATPLDALLTHHIFDFLTQYFEKEEVEKVVEMVVERGGGKVVVGWPKQRDGSDTNNTPLVRAFLNRFKKLFPEMPLALQDEWNTSNLAMTALIESGVKKKGRRDKLAIDQVSAVLILQSYMESKT